VFLLVLASAMEILSTPKPDQPHGFVAIDSMPIGTTSNALANHESSSNSYGFRAAVTFKHDRFLVEGSERDYVYDHHADTLGEPCSSGSNCNTIVGSEPSYRSGICPGNGDPGCVTVIGHTAYENGASQSGQVYVPTMTAEDHEDELHAAYRVANAPLYLGVGMMQRSSNYAGYPKIMGLGLGATYLPNFQNRISPYGSLYYYPEVAGTYRGATATALGPLSGATFILGYHVISYELGTVYTQPNSGLFMGISLRGDRSQQTEDAPSSVTHNALALSIGYHY
jgi:hypothetical protein